MAAGAGLAAKAGLERSDKQNRGTSERIAATLTTVSARAKRCSGLPGSFAFFGEKPRCILLTTAVGQQADDAQYGFRTLERRL